VLLLNSELDPLCPSRSSRFYCTKAVLGVSKIGAESTCFHNTQATATVNKFRTLNEQANFDGGGGNGQSCGSLGGQRCLAPQLTGCGKMQNKS
jgi:hypothetical protein